MRYSWKQATTAAIAVALSTCGWLTPSVRAADAGADGKEWILDSNNWQQGEGLLPPVVLERVKKGDYWYKVLPVDPEAFKHNYSQKFWDASEANAGKFDLDPETCGLKDVKTGKPPVCYCGYPCPKMDPKEPLAG